MQGLGMVSLTIFVELLLFTDILLRISLISESTNWSILTLPGGGRREGSGSSKCRVGWSEKQISWGRWMWNRNQGTSGSTEPG